MGSGFDTILYLDNAYSYTGKSSGRTCAVAAKKRALEIVSNNNVGMFGTVDKNGNPFIKAMLYVEHDGLRTFWFCSNTSSKRAKHIADHPDTCLYFYEGFDGVMLSGHAELSCDDDMRNKFWSEEMLYHYPEGPTDPDYLLIKFTAHKGNYYSAKKNVDFKIE